MRTPKGFGKHYFTLVSIQAHSVAHTLHATSARTQTYSLTLASERESDEAPPPDEEAMLACYVEERPCHCNCFFNRRTHRILRYSKTLCFKHCNCRFYSFRRSGTHPPVF